MENIKEKFYNVAFTIYSEVKFLELYIEIVKEFNRKQDMDSELLGYIKGSFNFQIVCIFSRISESDRRKSASIFYLRKIVESRMDNLVNENVDKKHLEKLVNEINKFEKKYSSDIHSFGDIKDVKISHNDLKLSKKGLTKRISFNLNRMKIITNDLKRILFKFISKEKDNFDPKLTTKLKQEICLFCNNLE